MEKHSVSRLSYLFAHLHLLSSYSFSSDLLSSNLPLLSASALLCFSSVHIVGSLTSKLPSIKLTSMGIYQMDSNGICIMNERFKPLSSYKQQFRTAQISHVFPLARCSLLIWCAWHTATKKVPQLLASGCLSARKCQRSATKTSLWVSKPRKLQEHVSKKKLSFPSVSYSFIATPKKITTSSIVRCIYQCNGREL